MRRRAGLYDRPVNFAEHPVIASLTPVFLLIGAGFLAGRRNWIRDSAVKDLSNLVFLLLIPSLLFRTMSSVRFEQLDLRPIAAYFPAALLLLCGSIAWRGFNRGSVVRALAGTFSNMVMIGITLVGLAYGQAGLVTLLTLVSVHALILLTVGSVVLELAVAREARQPQATGLLGQHNERPAVQVLHLAAQLPRRGIRMVTPTEYLPFVFEGIREVVDGGFDDRQMCSLLERIDHHRPHDFRQAVFPIETGGRSSDLLFQWARDEGDRIRLRITAAPVIPAAAGDSRKATFCATTSGVRKRAAEPWG